MAIDQCIFAVARKHIVRAVQFSKQNRRDLIWSRLKDVDSSDKAKKADLMMKKFNESLDKTFFMQLVQFQAGEQQGIQMAIENCTNDTLEMLNL